MFREFREFIDRGNVMDLAVAVVIGAAFGKIISTLVEGVIMPPVGLILNKVDFANLFHVLDKSKGVPETIADAKTRGIPVVAYGQFLNDVVNFVIIAFVVFLIVRQVNRIKSKLVTDNGPTTKDCPHCLSAIPIKATRCKDCTAELQAA
jgi:large conductance mechanosensitive channel